jgi:iron complex transport system ATP-binding protein
LLWASNIRFAYGREAGRLAVLEDVSLGVARGGVLGILGPNGSGKTTLLKVLAGLLRPDGGIVQLDGHDLARLSRAEVARRIAVVPQETHPAFEYTALEIVLMGRYPHLGAFAIEGPDDLRIAREALEATGTTALESRYFDTLSGGEKQRVVIAAALAQAAEILLLDEPTASLDLAYQLEIAALITRLNRERGVTLILSTHDLNLAASVCSRLTFLRDGRVLAAGETAQVLTTGNVERTFDVHADVAPHPRTGHLVVVPVEHRTRARS